MSSELADVRRPPRTEIARMAVRLGVFLLLAGISVRLALRSASRADGAQRALRRMIEWRYAPQR